jgi:hypothetical protein
MLEIKNKQKLADEAFKLAQAFHLMRYRDITYIPADCETLETSVTPPPERTVWLPMSSKDIRRVAAAQFSTLFGSDGELRSFEFMVAQVATEVFDTQTTLLVRTDNGLRELTEAGELAEPTGDFRPNYLVPMLNTDQAEKDRVFNVISDWLNSDEEAHSLLRHLATSLAPGWSAVKYVIFIGEGRNGKGVLLKMLKSLFGKANISNVTRQMISEQSPAVCDLNGTLLNIVFDGRAEYLKDSGTEKSLIAGEEVAIRKLYESTSTLVQTNALFIEGLNHEPKSKDKSSALQKRLVRFQFSNVYEFNLAFEKRMLREDSLGAFLALLMDHYVVEDKAAEMLTPTAKSIELQLESMYSNSIGLQFLKWFELNDALGCTGLLGTPISGLVDEFRRWRLKENDLGTWAEPDVVALFAPLLDSERKSQREGGKVRKVRVITGLKPETAAFIGTLEGVDDDEAFLDALVDD